MKLVIGCDNAALELKNVLISYLEQTKNIEFEDVGILESKQDTYYPKIAARVATIIQKTDNDIEYGILLCGTGIGMALTANKFKGIRAAVCHDIYSAERAKKSNNTNVITMGARIIGEELAKRLIDMWLDSHFDGGRSAPKVALIEEYEQNNFMV